MPLVSQLRTPSERIREAKARQRTAIDALALAFHSLCEAQNAITDVEGDGSPEAYNAIADAYQAVAKLREQVRAIDPTGLFE